VPAAVDVSPETMRDFRLSDHWELNQPHKRGVFNFRQHQVNYLMLTRTAHPNNEPYRSFRRIADLTSDLAHSELVFQLGFKMKLVESAFAKPDTRPDCDAISPPTEVRSSSAGRFRWPGTSWDVPSCFRGTGKA